MEWQSIETAPRDGTEILAFGLRNGEPVFAVTWWRKSGPKRMYIGWGEFNKQYWPATHWMPLPEPPEGQT